MNLRDFFVGRAAVIGLLVLIGLCLFAYKTYAPAPAEETPQPAEPAGPPAFSWRFEDADSLNPDGNPETRVLLDVTYADGSKETRLVDTTHASCNELPETEAGIIQCYGAGLGYRFRIIESGSRYLVQRKTFEEASPEYEPPAYEYETVLELEVARR